ncbi:3591_t:CDS:1 [Funneliformis geosporum]|uniref:3591_t:CDS:1 n=1 Tax=Funneliformis geosporum TaxID=1117311 RepID=A0A9W4SBR0_9GLOM|nr:3591_t:CDS:1 [Funneliformis geosporum]
MSKGLHEFGERVLITSRTLQNFYSKGSSIYQSCKEFSTPIFSRNMDNNNEYTSDTDAQDDEISSNTARRKTIQKPVAKSNVKRIRVNFTNNNSKTKKSSYVWEYFQIENGRDVCKIIIFLKGEEVECKRNYKHDGGTGNMKQHLQTKHGISSPDDLQLNSNEKIQTHIDKMIRKVTPHRAPKQAELKQVTAEWLVTDSLPFNVVHRKDIMHLFCQIIKILKKILQLLIKKAF